VPEDAIIRPNPWAPVITFFNELVSFLPFLGCAGFIIAWMLTAVEAAILMEQPLDKILTMILFATLKKGAARLTSRDPLRLEVAKPLPEGLHAYETEFLAAFEKTHYPSRRKALHEMMVNLVKSVAKKMKGFSRKETIAYYRDIIMRAWAQVEAAETPEVKSQKYDEVMEWTMLDRDYDDRTRRVFQGGPVYVPVWWGRYDPGYRPSVRPVTATGAGGSPTAGGPKGASLPHLPGADFAASVVNGVQDFSSKMVGSVSAFTSSITNRTNPIPKSTSSGSKSSWRSSGGGGCACACACACAGCACACAGGGR